MNHTTCAAAARTSPRNATLQSSFVPEGRRRPAALARVRPSQGGSARGDPAPAATSSRIADVAVVATSVGTDVVAATTVETLSAGHDLAHEK
jgi:hypothetical protein